MLLLGVAEQRFERTGPSPSGVLIVGPPAAAFGHALQNELRKYHVVVPTLARVGEPLGEHPAAAVVFTPSVCGTLEVLAHIEGQRRSHPQRWLYCCVDTSERGCRQLGRLARAGADGLFVVNGTDDLPHIAQTIQSAVKHALPSIFARELVECVPWAVRHTVTWVLRRAWQPVHASDVATFFREDATTVSRQLRRAGVPPLRTLTTLSRAAHVAVELDLTQHTEATIAQRLGFGSDTSVRMLAQRTLGFSVSSLRGFAMAWVHAKWCDALARHRLA